MHYSTFSTSVTGIVLLKIQMYEKKANCTSSPEKKVIKNMVDYEVYRPVYVRVRDAADGRSLFFQNRILQQVIL